MSTEHIKTCKKCGKLVSQISSREGLCFDCVQQRKKDYAIYSKVRAYVKEHPNCSASEVIMKYNTSIEKIQEFINEGLLEVTNDPYYNTHSENENKGAETKKSKENLKPENLKINTDKLTVNLNMPAELNTRNKAGDNNAFQFRKK